MSKAVTILVTATQAKLVDANSEVKKITSDLVSYPINTPSWSGNHSMFEWGKSQFPAGFAAPVARELKRKGYTPVIIRKPAPEPLGPKILKCNVSPFGFNVDYWYQPHTVKELMKHRQMIAQLATGAGKSIVARLAYAHIGRKTLFLTTRTALMYQMKEGVHEDMGEDVGQVGDGEYRIIDGLNVGMVQTFAEGIEQLNVNDQIDSHLKALEKREKAKITALIKAQKKKVGFSAAKRKEQIDALKLVMASEREHDAIVETRIKARVKKHNERRLKVIKDLESFEFIIMEEAHESSGDGYFNVMNTCKNAHYRLALTATPFMGDNQEKNFRLMATSGEVTVRVTEEELIDAGILAKPYFCYYSQPQPPLGQMGSPYRQAYEKLIVENAYRNHLAATAAVTAAKAGQSTLILVKETKHGKIVQRMIETLSPSQTVKFISGENDNDERKAALKSLDDGGVVIATKILDVGVDVPSVGFLILLGGDKGEVALRQRIGRVLRRKKRGPNICYIMDFLDEHNKHIRVHAKTRKSIIGTTDGFSENLLPDDQGFDWDVFD